MLPIDSVIHGPFVRDLIPILHEYQAELRSLVRHAPSVESPVDLQRLLGINYSLSWMVIKAANAPSPLQAGPFMPSHVSIRKLITAAKSKDCMPPGCRLEQASASLQTFIGEHAEDRSTFDTIVLSLTDSDSSRHDKDLKRTSYRASRQIFGRHADVTFACSIVAPSTEPGSYDLAFVNGYHRFQRLRPNASLLIGDVSLRDPEHVEAGVLPEEPIDREAADRYGVPIIERFCSSPVEPLLHSTSAGDGACYYFTKPDVGRTSAVDLVLGQIARRFPIKDAPNNSGFFTFAMIPRVPSVVMILDTLIHRSLYDGDRFEITVYNHHWTSPPGHFMSGSFAELPIQESGDLIGQGLRATRSRDVPWYDELMADTFTNLSWNPDEFNAYRCRVEYPVLGALIRTRV